MAIYKVKELKILRTLLPRIAVRGMLEIDTQKLLGLRGIRIVVAGLSSESTLLGLQLIEPVFSQVSIVDTYAVKMYMLFCVLFISLIQIFISLNNYLFS